MKMSMNIRIDMEVNDNDEISFTHIETSIIDPDENEEMLTAEDQAGLALEIVNIMTKAFKGEEAE